MSPTKYELIQFPDVNDELWGEYSKHLQKNYLLGDIFQFVRMFKTLADMQKFYQDRTQIIYSKATFPVIGVQGNSYIELPHYCFKLVEDGHKKCSCPREVWLYKGCQCGGI